MLTYIMTGLLLTLAVAVVVPAVAGEAKKGYPPPAPEKNTSGYGANIQRTMTLLATSTPEHRNRVRILVYGQSISAQDWWHEVERDLRARFPNADIELENRSIGGFGSQWLVRVAEHDLYPFYPDLMIFHVFGAHNMYEEIIANTRKRTTAEIAICTDHLGGDEKANDQGAYENQGWTKMMMDEYVPSYAARYGCGMINIREGWKQYVIANGLKPPALLADGIHLNAYGNFLYAELVKRQLVYRPDLPQDDWKDLVRTYEVGKDVKWTNGKLVLEFDGNRIDAVAGEPEGGRTGTARVRIDGRKPSELNECFAFTRPSQACETWMPGIKRVSSKTLRVAEDWTVRVTAFDPKTKVLKFEVVGSQTGPDGKGTSNTNFVSNSGRVIIDADVRIPLLQPDTDWHMLPGKDGVIPVGYEIKWKCVPMFVEVYKAPRIENRTREYPTTLVQGLDNGKHTIELMAEGDVPPIRFLRVYRPPVSSSLPTLWQEPSKSVAEQDTEALSMKSWSR
jgi:hypothetical protein